ncbi:MAG TPA: hypothetical protein VF715_03080 [Thermoleophilaceae bacterium]|jgi:hypothetical protein
MTYTPALGEFFQRLGTDAALQRTYQLNPARAADGFKLTSHEREAVVTADLDGLVVVGAAPTVEQLPAVVRNTSAPGPEITRAVNRFWSNLASMLASIPLPPFLRRGSGPPPPGPPPPG